MCVLVVVAYLTGRDETKLIVDVVGRQFVLAQFCQMRSVGAVVTAYYYCYIGILFQHTMHSTLIVVGGVAQGVACFGKTVCTFFGRCVVVCQYYLFQIIGNSLCIARIVVWFTTPTLPKSVATSKPSENCPLKSV